MVSGSNDAFKAKQPTITYTSLAQVLDQWAVRVRHGGGARHGLYVAPSRVAGTQT